MTGRRTVQPEWAHVRGEVVRSYRERKRLTRRDVAEMMASEHPSFSEQTLKRVEKKGAERYRLSRGVAKGLARIIGADVDVLTGEKPGDAETSRNHDFPELCWQLPRAFHNSLALMCVAYSVSPATIIANSPLLFSVAAERSLRRRSRALQEQMQAVYAVECERAGLHHLGRYVVRSADTEEEFLFEMEPLHLEEEAIANRDIIGERTREVWPLAYEDEGRSPFTDFLQQEAKEVGLDVSRLSYPEHAVLPLSGEDGTDVLAETISFLVGDDKELQSAIEVGDVILPPKTWKALRTSSAERRMAAIRQWMEGDNYSVELRRTRDEVWRILSETSGA